MTGETPKTEELPKTTTNVIEALNIPEAKKIGEEKAQAVIDHKPDLGLTGDVPELVVVPKEQPKKPVEEEKNPPGRPTVMTDMVLAKLEQAFQMDCTDKEACFYAGISVDALYDYQKKNPGFSQRKEGLKQKPALLVRQQLMKSLETTQGAQWYAEHKMKKEFSVRIESTGADGKDLVPLSAEQQAKIDSVVIGIQKQNGETK